MRLPWKRDETHQQTFYNHPAKAIQQIWPQPTRVIRGQSLASIEAT